MSNSKCQFDRTVYKRSADTGLRGIKVEKNPLNEIVYTPFFGKKEEPISLDCNNQNQSNQGYLPGWLPLPMPELNSQTFYGLYAVYPYAENHVALLVDGTTDYQVDWGDGTVDTVIAGVKAQHVYNYEDLGEETFYEKGQFRQAIVKITMTSGGNMTSFSLDQSHDDFINGDFSWSRYANPWLNVNIDGPNLTYIKFSGQNAYLGNLKRVGLYNLTSLTEFDTPFYYCMTLKTLEITGTSSLESIEYLIDDYTYPLKELPLFDTSGVTDVYYLWDRPAAEYYPLYDFSNVTSFETATGGNTVHTVPAWNLSNAVTGEVTFYTVADIDVIGLRITSFIDSRSRISKEGLIKFFNNLGTAVPDAFIEITCESGLLLSPAEIEIATNKGFTVTIS